MKRNICRVISILLIVSLCGCTTQTVEDAQSIVDAQTEIYKYEYETETNGEVVTQYHEEKPTGGETEPVTGETAEAMTGQMTYVSMGETFGGGQVYYTVLEAIATTSLKYGYEILDEEYADGIMNEEIHIVESSSLYCDEDYNMINKKRRFLWVKLRVDYSGTNTYDTIMQFSLVKKCTDGELRPSGGVGPKIDKAKIYIDSEYNGDDQTVTIAPGTTELWLFYKTFVINEGEELYMSAPSGLFMAKRYNGVLVKLDYEDKG